MPLESSLPADTRFPSSFWRRTTSTAWRVVASLALLAWIWTILQLVRAAQQGGVAEILPTALVVYLAGLGYLALTAAIASRCDRAIRAGSATPGLLWVGIAHLLVVAAALGVASRGVFARGLLVGLGTALIAWGVVAILAVAVQLISLATRSQRLTGAGPAARFGGALAVACLGCVALLGIGLAYLESRPLPNLPVKPHLPTGLEAGGTPDREGTSATHGETAPQMRDS